MLRCDLTNKQLLKRFRTECQLKKGGFGVVHKALDTNLHKDVEIKFSNSEGHEILLKEVVIIQQIPEYERSPYIAYYESYGQITDSFSGENYLVIQFYKEGSLSDLNKDVKLTLEQRHFILEGLLKGIKFLHDNNIIHCDLKPGNILMAKDDDAGEDERYVPKIADFGISKLVDPDKSRYSNTGGGTPAYASPEQVKVENIRKNSDLWSFGVIAFQLYTGNLPFNKTPSSESEYLEQIKDFVIPDSINSIPEPWQEIIRNCLKVNPDERIKSSDECLEKIAEYKENGIISSDAPEVVQNNNVDEENTIYINSNSIEQFEKRFEDCEKILSEDSVDFTQEVKSKEKDKKQDDKKAQYGKSSEKWKKVAYSVVIVSALSILGITNVNKIISNHSKPSFPEKYWKAEDEAKQAFNNGRHGIQFISGEADIIFRHSDRSLGGIVSTMKRNPQFELHIIGHTDNFGDPEGNLDLSVSRANAVRQYLISAGVDSVRLYASGKGDTQPIETNETDEGRAENRRIEFLVTSNGNLFFKTEKD